MFLDGNRNRVAERQPARDRSPGARRMATQQRGTGMSGNNRPLHAILLMLAGFALVAAVPHNGRAQEKEQAGKEDLKGIAGGESAGGIIKPFTGYARIGRP